MPGRERHTKPEVEEALADLTRKPLRIVVKHHGHVWGRIYCNCQDSGHQVSINSTPKNAGNEAKRLRAEWTRWERQHEATRASEGGAKRE